MRRSSPGSGDKGCPGEGMITRNCTATRPALGWGRLRGVGCWKWGESKDHVFGLQELEPSCKTLYF